MSDDKGPILNAQNDPPKPESYTESAATLNIAIDNIADYIKDMDTYGAVEHGTTIFSHSDEAGVSHVAGDYSIYTSEYSDSMGAYQVPSNTFGTFEALIHDHPIAIGDENGRLDIARYPSAADWNGLATLHDYYQTGGNQNVIVGPDGGTRAFDLGDRAYYESLTPEQMRDGVGLPPVIQ